MSIDIRSERRTVQTENTSSLASPSPSPPARGWWKRGLLALGLGAGVVVVGSLMLTGLSPQDSTTLLTHSITRGDLIITVTEEGTLESATNKEIKCTVKGGSTILKIIADGTVVKPGDELIQLDASTIEEEISQQRITYETALANKIQAESDLAVAEIGVTEYLEGTFRKEMQTAESNVAIAEENLRVAQNVLDHSNDMFRKGYVSQLELDGNRYSLQHARLQLELMKTEVDVLERFTKPKTLQELNSSLTAAKGKLAAEEAALELEEGKLKRLEEQRDGCVIHAEVAGMVVYPETEPWRNEPAIEEGSTVREQQTLLRIPDLNDMQVKVGIHESKVRQLKPGMKARIEIQDVDYTGEVDSVAKQASPTGWWDGNVRKFNTIVKLGEQADVRPGMSAEVEITVAHHQDVLTVPVAGVVQLAGKFYCWVKNGDDTEKRALKLGDSNDQYTIVEQGLDEGDQVVLNPLDIIGEAQSAALQPGSEDASDEEGGEDGDEPSKAGGKQSASSDDAAK